MTRKERYQYVIDWFKEHNPEPETELNFENPFQLLVAVILSAQCTDKRVNMVTPDLFLAFPDAERMSRAEFEDINPFIKTVSFANNKTRHLIGMARMLTEQFGGEVPQSVEELVQLPGVGRKTANVITSVVWSQPNMAVDTHVFRVAARIGLTSGAKNPAQAEEQLVKHLPEDLIYIAHHWLILHGRYICIARRPLCEQCGLQPVCKFFQQEMKYVVAGTRPYNPEKDAVNKVDGGKKRKPGKPGLPG
jgi:endonuclease-3